MDTSLELLNATITEIIEKSSVFGSVVILIDKNGKAVVNQFAPKYLGPFEKVLSQAILHAAMSTLAMQQAGGQVNFVNQMIASAQQGISIPGKGRPS